MRLADVAIQGIVDSVAFRASSAPYLLMDTRLRIRAANLAYEQATLKRTPDISGELMFEVFPDNPATPEARSVDRLGRSLERALVTGAPDRMDLQRYDVLADDGAFVEKSWLPTNTPVRDADGTVVGILHHVEDVTHLLAETALEHQLLAPPGTVHLQTSPGSGAALAALHLDSAQRQARARALIERSARTLERVSERFASADARISRMTGERTAHAPLDLARGGQPSPALAKDDCRAPGR